MGNYYKAAVALVAAVATALIAAVGNGELGDLSGYDWVKVALVIVGGTAATWWADNVPGTFGSAIKAVLGAATAGLTAWTVAYENDEPAKYVISQGEWLTIALAVFTALTAVYQVNDHNGNLGLKKA